MADQLAEVGDEVGLVEVAQVLRQRRPRHWPSRLHARDGLVQPVALDDPLRADAHVVAEQALQRAQAQAEAAGELVGRVQLEVVDDAVDDAAGEFGALVQRREVLAKKSRGGLDGRRVVDVLQRRVQRAGGVAEQLGQRDRAVGDRGDRAAQHGPERAGPELDAERRRPAFEHARPAPGVHAPGVGASGLDDDVDVGVRQGLLNLRRQALEVPAHAPEVLDAIGQVVRRGHAPVRELAQRQAVQHAARLGAQRPSRISNRFHRGVVSMRERLRFMMP